MTQLSGWGRSVWSPATIEHPKDAAGVAARVTSAGPRGVLARGLGRSYGDAAMASGGTVLRLDAFHDIGPISDAGVVEVGAGVSFRELIANLVPQGWFVPVTPGTQHVTMGGALASDVHGKNHHRDGTFGRHVDWVELVDGTGQSRRLDAGDPLFGAVAGGMGLSGVMTRMAVRGIPVDSDTITVHTTRTRDLDETMAVLQSDDAVHPYTVAWVDTLAAGSAAGRGVVTSGDHTPAGAATGGKASKTFGSAVPAPLWAPSGLLNRWSVRAFNEAYFRRAPARPTVAPASIPSFFHPLDVVDGWNRMYGARGFLQYQIAVADAEVVRTVLDLLRREHVTTFLAVLKRFGPAVGGPLSFPIPGWTLALDIPVGAGVAPVLERADDLVVAAGGRTYFAKDSRVRPELVPVMYPRLGEWRALRDELDPSGVFVSDLARRLSLC